MRERRKTTQKSKRRPLAVVVLAAGEGKRMRSRRAKVMHELAGKPLLLHVLDTAAELRPDRLVVVVGKGAEEVVAAISDRASVVVQEPRLGTGHAVSKARAALKGFSGDVFVLCGDAPLMRSATLRKLRASHQRSKASVTVLSMIADDPSGYGRVVRAGDGSISIVEHADATAVERTIDEVNTGTYCFDAGFLFRALGTLSRSNAQGEYYLTDFVAIAARKGGAACQVLDDADEGLGVNSRVDLAAVEAALQQRLITEWMDRGVTFIDPASAYLGADVEIGTDVTVGPGVVLLGRTIVGDGVRIDGASRLGDTVIGRDAHVRWGVVADAARIANGARVGPSRISAPARCSASGPHRQLRRDQEGDARARHEGEPSHLPRRREIGPRHERRRRHHHLQLRRLPQAPDRDRRSRADRQRHAAGRAGHGRRRRLRRGGHDGHARRAAGRARVQRQAADR